MRTLYFDIDGTILNEVDSTAKPALAEGRFERLVKAGRFDRIVCVGNMGVVLRQLDELDLDFDGPEIVFNYCAGTLCDPEWFRKAVTLARNPERRVAEIELDSDWWYADDLARYYFEIEDRIDVFEQEIGKRVFAPRPEGDGSDFARWLERLADGVATRPSPPQVTDRRFRGDDDFRRVRSLLVDTHALTPTGFNWEVRRWDGWRYYRPDPAWDSRREEEAHVWETDDGKLVATVHPEGTGDAHLQIHPDFRHLEEEVITWAEDHLATRAGGGGERQLSLDVFEYDSSRRDLLVLRGYEQTRDAGFVRRLRLENQLPAAPKLPDGYALRTPLPDDEQDCEELARLLNAAFGRSSHVAAEFRTFAAHAICFHRELDVVAEAPNGTFAAYVGVPWEETNRYGVFEPVCTHPDHRRLGLARSLMEEALRRLDAHGAVDVYVGTGDEAAANRVYRAVGFDEAYQFHRWCKAF